ncbi:MAG: phosphoribosyl 1,2-cyclic phosphodiesterase [Halieaceae bacterium]
MKIASLGSGSKGNATVLRGGATTLLVDCGFSLREMRKRAPRLDLDLASITAILVTHEHGDHCSGVRALARAYGLPVYLSYGTAGSGRLGDCSDMCRFNADAEFSIGDIQIRAVAVPHDAREPVQYCFEQGGTRVGVLTDLGCITPHVLSAYAACDLLLLEFNHDPEMLARGPYPAALKRRVGGDWGHLSNEQALGFLKGIDTARLQQLVVAHTSAQNNSRESVESLLHIAFPELLSGLCWAEQEEGFSWLKVSPGPGSCAASSAVQLSLQA